MADSSYKEWDLVYRDYPASVLPWELGRPRKMLVDLIESGGVQPGNALDLCCGLGTNTIYMAQKGFEVATTDISKHALRMAKEKAKQARVEIGFVLASFVKLPFKNSAFDFVFDMGCFHHVETEDRTEFIHGVHRVLKPEAQYQLTCFSDKNGPAWNHFTKEQIAHYFAKEFEITRLEHFRSVEADNYTRFFYTALMQSRKKPNRQTTNTNPLQRDP